MKEKVLYIYPSKSSFINSDIAFLQKKYTVKTQELSWSSVLKLPINLLAQCFFLLMNVKSSKAIIVSFGGYFSLFPTFFGKLFRTPIFIILNGTESVSFPKYDYGSLRKPILRFFIKKSLQKATKLFPVDASLIQQTHTFDKDVKYKKQGYKSFFPEITTPVQVIANGFDINFWKTNTILKRELSFISVASINSESTFKLKGFDFIFETAKRFPKHQFTLVGISDEFKRSLNRIPKNIIIYPFVTVEKLKEFYKKHQFYLQLSVNEGFGCSLAEAMLCGCIPIISNVGALPNVVGGIGLLVKKRTLSAIEEQFLKAISLEKLEKDKLSQMSRERIVANFKISKREQLLLQEIENTT